MGDDEADRSTTKLGWQLLEHQIDWDYFDEQSLSGVAKIEDGGFKNLSGQVYRAVIFPSCSVITRAGLERLQAFVKAGGKVIFVGNTPKLVVDKTFLNAKDTPNLSFATLIEPVGDITPRILAVLPKPDVTVDAAFPRLTYTHRSWRDADMYLFFNESAKQESRTATVAGKGQAQSWDMTTGEIHEMASAVAEGNSVKFPLMLGPFETKVVVVGPLPAGVAAPEPSFADGTTLAELDVAAPYRVQFTVQPPPASKRVYLEIGDVHEYARVRLNGKELDVRAWQPYRWDVTDAIKAGANDLEIEVRGPGAGRGGTPAGTGRGANTTPHIYGSVGGIGGRGAAAPPTAGIVGPVRFVAR
jgi:hypothetical protein